MQFWEWVVRVSTRAGFADEVGIGAVSALYGEGDIRVRVRVYVVVLTLEEFGVLAYGAALQGRG